VISQLFISIALSYCHKWTLAAHHPQQLEISLFLLLGERWRTMPLFTVVISQKTVSLATVSRNQSKARRAAFVSVARLSV
jgi:hypothetical protein